MRRHCAHLFPLISMLLLFSTFSYGQAWSNILASSRAINWSNAGLPTTLPDGETTPNPWTPPTRTQCGSTISSGASPATINAALAACSAGTYVLLGTGAFAFNNANLTLYAHNGVTLRGSGPQSTFLNLTGTSQIQFGIAWNNESCKWASGFSVGSTSLTMSSCSGTALLPGELIFVTQCDNGYSGTPCTGTAPVDNGALLVCGDNTTNISGTSNPCQTDSPSSGPYQHQQQALYVTSVSGSGTYTVNFTPGIYMANWASGQTPRVTWITSSSAGNTVTPYGNGLEDLTVYTTSDTANYSINLNLTYASWVKGVRFVGSAAVNPLFVGNAKNCLVMNNYFFADLALDAGYPAAMAFAANSDSLVLNNIMASGVPWAGEGNNSGNVFAYNYGRDTFTMYYENRFFEHHAYASFELSEADQIAGQIEDDTWGTQDLQTRFRNYWSGWDPPYWGAQSPYGRAAQDDAYSRFINYVGNAFGSTLLTTYQGATGVGTVYDINQQGTDSLVATTMIRWGNCDTVTATCRFQSSEVPTSLSGNAIPFENSVPSNENLPCSFFLAGYTSTTCTPHANGGTGLSWWKVCTAWSAFPTSCSATNTQPFPPVGPDVSGGPYVNGTAYDVPASIAWQSLPIDTTYQNSYTIASSSWSSSNGGTETLTFNSSALPKTTHLMGPFQISGTGSGTCTALPGNGECLMTASTATTVSYALASNPGSLAGSVMKFPDVRQFDERVYENDPGGTDPPPSPPTGLGAVVD